MLVNLLTNAAKYTPSGGRIQLIAGVEGDEVVFRVRDNGVGIPPELLPRMFDLFAQGDRSLARSEGGLGIGLTLVRSLAELHGGTVTATSDGPGKGSEFVVRLPAAGGAGPGPDPTRQEDPRAAAARRLPGARRRRQRGHGERDGQAPEALGPRRSGSPTTARTPSTSAREHRPEVVLLDIGLPGMDGYEVAARLRATARAPPGSIRTSAPRAMLPDQSVPVTTVPMPCSVKLRSTCSRGDRRAGLAPEPLGQRNRALRAARRGRCRGRR